MILNKLTPRKSLNKAYLKVKPNRSDIDVFKKNLVQLIDQTNDTESEEFHKNLVSDFLKDTYYKNNHSINTKERNDLVIHNGKDAKSTVGVLIETKSPTNKAEMLTKEKINVKAFQELLLYYLRERITHKNLEIKHLIITNTHEWFIFNATIFNQLFAQNKELVKKFHDFEGGRLEGTTTDYFYKEIAEPLIGDIETEIEFTHFHLSDYQKPLQNNDQTDDLTLIALFKLLSPEHLLKLPFANDSNSLDKRFYGELLHIIGLSETQAGGKKLIERNKEDQRNTGSILENAIIELDSLDKISHLEQSAQFGETQQEKLFNVALELSITWINRILFLKLLEAQLISYHKGDTAYSFLNLDKIKNYDDLHSLFFQVLAKKHAERNSDVKEIFAKVPYLNSSLFEPTDIEQSMLIIRNLKGGKPLRIITSTVLKNDQGKKKTGKLPTLDYLFEFLNAYDFSSEGSEDIQEDNKTLINASVLGLIFEKINGYKDGSFFTPGFITMYMCRETIRKALVQKFNEAKDWKCQGYEELKEDLHEYIKKHDRTTAREEANKIVNSLKICDPAVGSGHFLVSALNEMIAIKSDLKILVHRDGDRVSDYDLDVVNDELAIADVDENRLFEYRYNNKNSQKLQETLFHEKQTIIENCLFGVDINPNSVKICRLRLWIELLKNAYYKNATELETLPNIDINIKRGNSLISRFSLDADIKQALKKSKWNIDSYKIAVSSYRNAEDKQEKREMETLIENIKKDFHTEISKNHPIQKKLDKLGEELYNLTGKGGRFGTGMMLFEPKEAYGTEENKKKIREKVHKIELEIEKHTQQLKDLKNNKIFENAFEWRFEFPEVLNDDGDFVGFDVMIGNPPYIRQEDIKEYKTQFKQHFSIFVGTADIYTYFYEKGFCLLSTNGHLCYITSNKWMRADYGKKLRPFFKETTRLKLIIDFEGKQIFENATVDTNILLCGKTDNSEGNAVFSYQKQLPDRENPLSTMAVADLSDTAFTLQSAEILHLKKKMEAIGTPLKEWDINIYRGVLTGFNEAFIIDTAKKDELIAQDPKSAEIIKPILRGRDIKAYEHQWAGLWLINSHNGDKNNPAINIDDYPAIKDHLDQYYPQLKKRHDQGKTPYNLRDCAYLAEFAKEKIIYPNMTKFLPFIYDEESFFINDKGFILTGENLKYLTAYLNSTLFKAIFKDNFPRLADGRELRKVFFQELPIPKISKAEQAPFIALVNKILTAKQKGKDTTALEAQVDALVYALYDLSSAEIAIVEGHSNE